MEKMLKWDPKEKKADERFTIEECEEFINPGILPEKYESIYTFKKDYPALVKDIIENEDNLPSLATVDAISYGITYKVKFYKKKKFTEKDITHL